MTSPDDTTVGARLQLKDRAQFSEDAKTASKSVKEIGSAAESAGTQAEAGGRKFTSLTDRIKVFGGTLPTKMKEVGVEAGKAWSTGLLSEVRKGEEETGQGGGILDRVGRGFTAAGVGAGRRFGESAHETAMEYIKTIGTTFAGYFAAEKAKEVFGESIQLANQLKVAQQQTAAAIKSTGDASGKSQEEIAEISERMGKLAGQSNIAEQGMANLLLTFPKIKGDNFNKAALAANNLAARLGISLPSAARMVGRALNDPSQGLTALSRVGIRFNDQQSKVIDNLVKTGHAAQAQGIILGELSKRVGGAAAASVTPSQRLHLAWEDFEENVGTKLLPIIAKLDDWLAKTLLPRVIQMGHAIHDWLTAKLIEFHPQIVAFGKWVTGTAVPALEKLGKGALDFAKWILQNIIPPLIKLAGWFEKNIIPDLARIWDWFGKNTIALKIIAVAIGLMIAPWTTVIAIILVLYNRFAIVRDIINAVGKVIAWAFDLISRHMTLFLAIVTGPVIGGLILIVTHWKMIKRWGTDAIDAIKNVALDVWDWIKKHWGLLLTIITGPFGAAAAFVIKHWGAIKTFFHDLPGNIATFFKDLGNDILSPFKWAFNEIAKFWNATVGKVHFTIPHWVPFAGGKGFGFPQMPELKAGGGPISAGRTYIVGENGPELFQPNVSGSIIPNYTIKATMNNAANSANRADIENRYKDRNGFATVRNSDERVSSARTTGEGETGQPIVLQLVVDRKVLAEAVYDDIKGKAARK